MDITKKIIINHLKKLKIKKGDDILIYSKQSSFGITKKNFSKILLNTLINYIGSSGTIVMPSYTFEDKNFVFDIKKIKSNYSTSLLVKEFFKRKKIIRSMRLIHSHIALGKKSKLFQQYLDPTISLGKGSDFDIMTKSNFRCIYLGCSPEEAATFLVHLEYLNKVPYRKKIIIKKKIKENKKIKIINVNYSNRPKKFKYNFNKTFNMLINIGAKVNIADLRFGKSYSIKLKNYLFYGNKLFKKNKFIMIEK